MCILSRWAIISTESAGLRPCFKGTTTFFRYRKTSGGNRTIFRYCRFFQTSFSTCRTGYCRSNSHASYKGARIHCDDGRQKGIQKRKSDYSSGICQPEAFPATLYIMPSLCQQMPVACTETRFHGIRSGRCDAANGQFRKRIL